MKLKQLGSNQTQIDTATASVLVSYQTPVVARVNGVHYRTEAKWSTTTSRHINQWLAGSTAETKPQAWFDALLD